jgi:predicted Rossmann fold flavoprotein
MASCDVLVLGAGAAGLMCAIQSGSRGRRVVVLERNDRAGRKIHISGGGRCNFTNLHCRPENFLSANPHFARSALSRYTPQDFLALVQKHRIPFHEKKLGQLFCDRSSRDIVEMLEAECREAGVRILFGTRISRVTRDGFFRVHTQDAEYTAPALVVATGGLSIPKVGASPLAYDLARQFGIRVQPCRPALVPLVFDAGERARWCDLTGVSTDVVASANGARFHEKMLFTHRGLSGPAILQISSYWRPGQAIAIDLLPEAQWTTALRARPSGRSLDAARDELRRALPQRLADRFLDLHSPADWTNASLLRLEEQTHRWLPIPAGDEGYDKAEVTAGGVDTADLSSRTLEARTVPGLFFIGECVDVTGHLGGYNFQWAWASGFAAGQAV